MSALSCREFRSALQAALRGRAGPERTAELAWHEHLLGCVACRELLSAEEALEELLATLPEPRLPPDLTARVLARLAGERASLDGLLELERAPDAPPGLSRRILAGLCDERRRLEQTARLERLLEGVPAPAVPTDLAARVLAGLSGERARPARFTLVRGALPPYAWAAAAAALLAVCALSWKLAATPRPEPSERADPGFVVNDVPAVEKRELVAEPRPAVPLEPEQDLPSDDLLAVLGVLERWELLFDEDLDVQLASLDAVEDELLALGLDDLEDGG